MLMETVYVFGDEACKGEPVAAGKGCLERRERWRAWKMQCKVGEGERGVWIVLMSTLLGDFGVLFLWDENR